MRLWIHPAPDNRSYIDAAGVKITFVRTASEVNVNVAGRVTIDSSPYLRTTLLRMIRKSSITALSIDASAVSYIDTSGIATLLEALKQAQRNSIELRVFGVTGQVRMLAEMTELPAIFEAAGSEVVVS